MSVNVAPDAANDARYGPSRRTSPSSLFSSMTTTTWSGRGATAVAADDSTGAPEAEGAAAEGAAAAGAGATAAGAAGAAHAGVAPSTHEASSAHHATARRRIPVSRPSVVSAQSIVPLPPPGVGRSPAVHPM